MLSMLGRDSNQSVAGYDRLLVRSFDTNIHTDNINVPYCYRNHHTELEINKTI